MGRFASLGGIKTNQGGVYWKDGEYLVELLEVKVEDTRKGLCFIVSGKTHESSNQECKQGTVCSQVIKLSGEFLDTYLGNVKQFVAAVMGIDSPDDYEAPMHESGYQPGVVSPQGLPVPDSPEAATSRFWDEAVEFLVSPEQPAKGMFVRLNCVTIITKGKGAPYTKHRWGPKVDMLDANPAEAVPAADISF